MPSRPARSRRQSSSVLERKTSGAMNGTRSCRKARCRVRSDFSRLALRLASRNGLSMMISRVCPGRVSRHVPGSPSRTPGQLLISTSDRTVRLVFESGRPIAHVARDLGVHREALRAWVRQARADRGERRDLLTSDEREELKRLRKENAELRRANAILKDASVYFATELDPTRRR